MAEIPTPFEWNPAWTKEEHKEVFEIVKKLDDNRDDADARKVCNIQRVYRRVCPLGLF